MLRQLCNCFRFKKSVRPNLYELVTQKSAVQVPEPLIKGRKVLVIDLDETLVHSSFTRSSNFDFHFILELQEYKFDIYVNIRPGAQQFLLEMSQYYEIIIFTASISEYANPVIDYLDPNNLCSVRLYRENCTQINNFFVKDLSLLNRPIHDIIIIDVRYFCQNFFLKNSAFSFMLQPMNAIHIINFIDDYSDQELYLMQPFLKLMLEFADIRPVHEWLFKYANLDRFNYKDKDGNTQTYYNNMESAATSNKNIPIDSPKGEEMELVNDEKPTEEQTSLKSEVMSSPQSKKQILFPN